MVFTTRELYTSGSSRHFDGANLDGAKYDAETVFPQGFDPRTSEWFSKAEISIDCITMSAPRPRVSTAAAFVAGLSNCTAKGFISSTRPASIALLGPLQRQGQ